MGGWLRGASDPLSPEPTWLSGTGCPKEVTMAKLSPQKPERSKDVQGTSPDQLLALHRSPWRVS